MTSITIPDSVTSIGSDAFGNCTSLTNITIPDSVTSIDSYAFAWCTDLISVTIGSGVTSIGDGAFYYCYKLVEIYNYSSLTIGAGSPENGSVGYYALNVYTPSSGASKLTTTKEGYIFYEDINTVYLLGYTGTETELVLPDTYNGKSYEIYRYAFYYAPIAHITIGNGVTSIGNYAFYYASIVSVTIGNSVTTIGDGAFGSCERLENIIMPNSVNEIGSSTFSRCTKLTSVYITDITAWCGITFKDAQANPLYYAGNLYLNGELIENLVIPNDVTTINSYAFTSCTSLTKITIPNSVTEIGSDAFSGCSGLMSVYITDITAWCEISFEDVWANPLYYAGNLYLNGELVEGELTIPADTTKIGSYAFHEYTKLTRITIPSSVTSIGDYAFLGCTGLTSITIPDKVTSIGWGAFSGCTAEIIWGENPEITEIGEYAFAEYAGTSIAIPESVTSIGEYAFFCASLTEITIPSSIEAIGNSTFYGCTNLTEITIPNSVTSIGIGAFYYCTSLTTVYYGGSAKDWSSITIGSANGYLTNATVYYYSEKAPALTEDGTAYNGNYWHYIEDKIEIWVLDDNREN